MLRGWGGQSNRILMEALGTRRLGHEIAFAVPHDSVLARKGRDEGIDVWPHFQFKPPAQLWYFLPDLIRLQRQVSRWRPDVIHTHGSQDSWLVAVLKALSGRDFPTVIRTKHNIFPWRMHRTNRWLYARMDGFVSISSYVEKQIVEYPDVGELPRALVPDAPEIEAIDQAEPVSIRDEIPEIPSDAFLWGSTGRLRSEKGFDVLLRAWARVWEKRKDCYLVIAGDGSDRSRLIEQASALGLGDDCLKFLGFRRDVPGLLKALDGYVLTSRSEGLGTAILEALAAGCPVVATNVGGIPDSVHHEQTGLLVGNENVEEIAAAMLRLMEEPGLGGRLGKAGCQLIKDEFTKEALAIKTATFYELLVNRKNGL
jgi:glycosyltransferase involved in cell wall biosynthesis